MIKLSKTWSYALKAVVYISESENKLVKIKDISVSLWISEALLRRIIADLEHAGILLTVKWRGGWVSLALEPNKISVYNLLHAVGEELWMTECTKGEYCENQESCSTTNFLWDLQKWFNTILKMYTIDKIIKK